MGKSILIYKATSQRIGISLILIALSLQSFNSLGQTVSGIVLSNTDKKPLASVTIGVLHKPIGTITDETGHFLLRSSYLSPSDSIRISMIGFKSQVFAVHVLKENETFELVEEVTMLQEVIVQNHLLHDKEIGTKSSSKRIVTGWAQHGTGGERGLKISFKKYPIQLEELNFFIAKNGYDSIILRLHIRSIQNNLPDKELLTQEILIPVTIKSGWVNTKLDNYNLVLDQDVVLSLEWLKAWGKCKGDECLLFSLSIFEGTLYAKEASEANWLRKYKKSPGIYLKVRY